MPRRPLLILLALAVLTLAAYWPVNDLGFVSYDDTSYVSMQSMVNQGFRDAAIYWSLTATHGANWHPLTSLSHILDVQLFWPKDWRPGGRTTITREDAATKGLTLEKMKVIEDKAAWWMHWENVLWHVLNTGLVFIVWRRLTGTLWPSALVAALFGWHPLHVESVAWISERKDVLSTALWLGTILAYLRWVERPTPGRYALIALGTALALLAKPMTVTLPCTLLLFDYWPLRRWPERSWRALLLEKAPLFLLVAGLCVTTVIVQRAEGATDFGEKVTYAMRIANALVSYARYLGKMFWPAELSPFYPHPYWWPWWAVLGATILFVTLCWLVWRERERRPWVVFGWCWYLGTLVPVIGLMQVGAQSIADRYTYVPLLGLFTILAWAGAEVVARRPAWRGLAIVAATVVLGACIARTWEQIPIWKDGKRLIGHALSIVGEHVILRREMAKALIVEQRPESEVNAQYQLGLKVDPEDAYFMTELGFSAARAKRWEEAQKRLEMARDKVPKEAGTYGNLGNMYMMKGDLEQSLVYLNKGLAMRDNMSSLHRLVAQVYVKQGRMTEAREKLLTAVGCDRWDWRAYNDLGVVNTHLDRFSEGIAALEHAIWINPKGTGIDNNLKNLRDRMGMSGRSRGSSQ